MVRGCAVWSIWRVLDCFVQRCWQRWGGDIRWFALDMWDLSKCGYTTDVASALSASMYVQYTLLKMLSKDSATGISELGNHYKPEAATGHSQWYTKAGHLHGDTSSQPQTQEMNFTSEQKSPHPPSSPQTIPATDSTALPATPHLHTSHLISFRSATSGKDERKSPPLGSTCYNVRLMRRVVGCMIQTLDQRYCGVHV